MQSKNVISVALENLSTFMIASIGFLVVGFPLMFGTTVHGLFGNSLWGLQNLSQGLSLGYVFVFFQMMFAATAVTIFAGSMSERTRLLPLQIASIISIVLIFPVYGHWVWGDLFLEQQTLLSGLRFLDFAGATVVHTTAGFISLAGLIVVGKRREVKNIRSNVPFAVLGVFILWFGWFGFNGGNLLNFSTKVGLILLNTNIAAACGMLGSLIAHFVITPKNSYLTTFFNGALGGLVASTAAAPHLSPVAIAFVGMVAGIVVHMAAFLLPKLNIDDAVGAVPIHLFGGLTGALLSPFFVNSYILAGDSRLYRFGVQLLGCGINFVWVFGTAFIMFKLLDKFIGLRVTEEEERKGLNIVEFDDLYSWEKYMQITGYEAEIQEQNKLLRKQTRLLTVTEEKERSKLARDLHDGVGQSLTALKVTLGLSRQQLAKEPPQDGDLAKQLQQVKLTTEKAASLAEISLQEMRNVLNNLKPENLVSDGLEGALRELVKNVNGLDDLDVRLRLKGVIPYFDETITLNIYRIIQEALTNIVKHSKAKRVLIIGDSKPGSNYYTFRIIDDGIGFQNTPEKGGIGIQSMNERVRMLGGRFQIISSEGHGTTVIVEVPNHVE